MLDFPLWKRAWFWGLTLACCLLAAPSLVSISGATWPSALPDPEVNLGLDLAGGSHILLEADPDEVARQRLQNMAESVNSTLDRADPAINFGDLSTADGRLSFMVESVADVDRARDLLEPLLNGEGMVREWDLSVIDETRVVLTSTEAGLERAINTAMDASQKVIEERINSLGTREPTIIRQGDNRIVVQVPGLQDPEQVKELIGKTAKLEFKLVNESALPTDLAAGIAEPGQQIFPYAPDSGFAGQNVAVYRLGGIDGNSLIKAQASRNQENQDVVVITFNQQGGARLLNGEGMVREWDLSVIDETRVVLTSTEAGLERAINTAMDASQKVIEERINSLGTREPTIIRQGDNRIVVQVPGLQDPEQVKELIGKTAKLEFKLVNESALPTDLAAGIAEPGQQIFPYAPDSGFAGQNVAVYRLGGIDGNSLIKAQASRNQENQDVVVITFNQQGGARFAKLTSENVGKQFAIILDGQVISAPVINDPIYGGTSEISGNFTAESAQQLAISLQSGALPVDLTVVEERTVGPDLGAESIRLGIIAMIVGSAAVIVLMIVTYGRFGIYATIALLINVLMILGIMALMNTTLTLPGIAGFVLTIGAAVDANVLINERIREERKRGRRVVAAVENGYKEASRAIFDANITNFIAGVLLFMFGTGPVRGFAVVLIIGLFTSVFTAVSLTRMWVAGWLRRARPQDINL